MVLRSRQRHEASARLGDPVGGHPRGELDDLGEGLAVAEEPLVFADPPAQAVALEGVPDFFFENPPGAAELAQAVEVAEHGHVGIGGVVAVALAGRPDPAGVAIGALGRAHDGEERPAHHHLRVSAPDRGWKDAWHVPLRGTGTLCDGSLGDSFGRPAARVACEAVLFQDRSDGVALALVDPVVNGLLDQLRGPFLPGRMVPFHRKSVETCRVVSHDIPPFCPSSHSSAGDLNEHLVAGDLCSFGAMSDGIGGRCQLQAETPAKALAGEVSDESSSLCRPGLPGNMRNFG